MSFVTLNLKRPYNLFRIKDRKQKITFKIRFRYLEYSIIYFRLTNTLRVFK